MSRETQDRRIAQRYAHARGKRANIISDERRARSIFSVYDSTFDVKRFINRRLRKTWEASCPPLRRNLVSFGRRSRVTSVSVFARFSSLGWPPPSLRRLHLRGLFLSVLSAAGAHRRLSPLVARIIEFPVISRRNTLYLLWRGMRVVLFGADEREK